MKHSHFRTPRTQAEAWGYAAGDAIERFEPKDHLPYVIVGLVVAAIALLTVVS